MAAFSNVGEILVSRKRIYVEWKIPNFFSRPQKADVRFESPPFCFFDAQWFISIYPNGYKNFYSVGWIDLYLNVLRPVSRYPVRFKLGIKHLGEDIYKGPGFSTFDSCNKGHGWLNICKNQDLFRLMRTHNTGGTLVIYCNARAESSASVNDDASETALDSIAVPCRNFQDLLPTEQKSDFTIEVYGHKFEVHKRILEARFPALFNIFNRNKGEKSDRTIQIFDCDPDAFHDFLQYAYTWKLEKMSWDNVMHLFKISEKYNAWELKRQCAEYMAEELLLDKAYDVLVIADIYNDKQLKECAKKMLTDNIVKIKTTDKWKSFVAQNPLLAVEILMEFVPNEPAQ